MSGDFFDVLGSDELPEGQARSVVAGRRPVAVVRVQGRVYAVDDTCPHRGGSMGQGDLVGHRLSCPQHAWCFDVRDGDGFFPQGVRLGCFDVQERDGRIWVAATPRPAPPVDFTPPAG